MPEVVITKDEYRTLKRESAAYRKLTARLFAAIVKDDVGSVMKDFAKTAKYSPAFLTDMENGLRKSSYVRP